MRCTTKTASKRDGYKAVRNEEKRIGMICKLFGRLITATS